MDASPLVKICGVATVADALKVAAAGADWIGLNFHPPSPRHVALADASAIAEALGGRVPLVGVFVDPDPILVRAAIRAADLDAVQLHGSEPPESWAELAADRFFIRAFRVSSLGSWRVQVAEMEMSEPSRRPDALLIDGFAPGLAGGTGVVVPDEVFSELPLAEWPRWILAGGLNPENVAERARRARPWMVDVASGVELAPGVKDPARVAALIAAVRGTG